MQNCVPRQAAPCSQSGACRALRRAAHAPQGSHKEMPSSHTGRPHVHFQRLYCHFSTPELLHSQFRNSLQAHPLNLCTPHLPALLNHIILPSLCMAKWPIHLHLTFQTSGLAPFIPTYSLHIPKGPHLSIFHSTVQYIHPPIAKRTYTM